MSVRVTVKIDGLDKAIKAMQGTRDENLQAIDREIKVSSVRIEAEGKKRAPVDTGFMRRSIRHDPQAPFLTGRVEAAAHYSGFVELGTYRSRAQPYLFPAVEAELPQLIKRITPE